MSTNLRTNFSVVMFVTYAVIKIIKLLIIIMLQNFVCFIIKAIQIIIDSNFRKAIIN